MTTLHLSRRQALIAGAALPLAPALFAAFPAQAALPLQLSLIHI